MSDVFEKYRSDPCWVRTRARSLAMTRRIAALEAAGLAVELAQALRVKAALVRRLSYIEARVEAGRVAS